MKVITLGLKWRGEDLLAPAGGTKGSRHKLAPFLTQRLVLVGLRCLGRRWKLLLDYRQMVEVRLQEKLLKIQSRAPIAPLTPISCDGRRLPTAA